MCWTVANLKLHKSTYKAETAKKTARKFIGLQYLEDKKWTQFFHRVNNKEFTLFRNSSRKKTVLLGGVMVVCLLPGHDSLCSITGLSVHVNDFKLVVPDSTPRARRLWCRATTGWLGVILRCLNGIYLPVGFCFFWLVQTNRCLII